MLCPYSFIILAIHTESQMQALDLYLEKAYIQKDILGWFTRGLCLGGLYSGVAYISDFAVHKYHH